MSRSPAVMAWVCAGSAYMSSTYFTVASFRSRPCHPVIRPDHALAPGGSGHSAPAQPPTRHYLAAPRAFAKVRSYRSLGAVSGHDDLHRPGITDLGEEHGHRVLRVCGKGTKVVLIPLPPAVGRAIDHAVGTRTGGPILLNTRGTRMDRH